MERRSIELGQQCLCTSKRDLIKFTTIPLLVISTLLITNTAITVNLSKTGTEKLNYDDFWPIDVPSSTTSDNITWIEPTLPSRSERVKFRYYSPNCLEKHAFHIGTDIFVSVCTYQEAVRVDIRRFAGDMDEGIEPTIRGIFLSPIQWEALKRDFTVIDAAIRESEIALNTPLQQESFPQP